MTTQTLSHKGDLNMSLNCSFLLILKNHIKMEKKQMLTGLYIIPTSNDSCNVFNVVDKIACQLGYLNCETQKDAAIIKYFGLLSKGNKEILTTVAEGHQFTIVYIEAEYDTSFIDCDTVHIPTDNEMKEHLNWN